MLAHAVETKYISDVWQVVALCATQEKALDRAMSQVTNWRDYVLPIYPIEQDRFASPDEEGKKLEDDYNIIKSALFRGKVVQFLTDEREIMNIRVTVWSVEE